MNLGKGDEPCVCVSFVLAVWWWSVWQCYQQQKQLWLFVGMLLLLPPLLLIQTRISLSLGVFVEFI